MPIYEFACPTCRRIFSFLSKRVNPDRLPVCPKCGNKNLVRQMSAFSAPRGGGKAVENPAQDADGMPDLNDPRMKRAMDEMEQDMAHMDENNPRHIAQMMRKMKDLMPPGSLPKEMDVAIRRLEAGEDPEKIEADMGDIFGDLMGGDDDADSSPAGGGYAHDSGLYDY